MGARSQKTQVKALGKSRGGKVEGQPRCVRQKSGIKVKGGVFAHEPLIQPFIAPTQSRQEKTEILGNG